MQQEISSICPWKIQLSIGCQPGAGKPRPLFFYAGFAVITGARDDSIAGLLSMPEPLENCGTVAMVFPG
jgi:hypothetical protein